MRSSARGLLICLVAVGGCSAAYSPREVAHRVLLRCRRADAFADRALHAELEKADNLSDSERGLATELTYGVMRTASALDYQLARLTSKTFAEKTHPATLCAMRIGAYELLHLSTPDYAAVDEAVSLLGPQERGRRSFANGVLRNLARQRDELPLPSDDASLTPIEALAIETSTPEWLLKELSSGESAEGAPPLLGDFDELAAWAWASQEQPALALRVNRRRATRDLVLTQLQAAGLTANKVPGLDDTLLLDAGGGSVVTLPGFKEGYWSVQDVGAQLIALLATPPAGFPPGSTVLDLCAAPGGKATHLGELLADGEAASDGEERARASKSCVHAVDVHKRKATLVRNACTRLGLSPTVKVHVADATSPTDLATILETAGCEGGADAVVLDAPCSGSGTLRRNPEHRYRAADPASYKELCTLQAKLLDSASACVRVGGTLTYSVCSPTLAETDECIAAFLKRSPNFELVPAAENEVLTQFVADSPLLGEGACVRTWTHRHPADSHFAALLRRRE